MPVTTPGEVKDVELIGSWFFIKLDNGIEGFFTDASGFGYEVEVVEKTDASTDTSDAQASRHDEVPGHHAQARSVGRQEVLGLGEVDPRRHARLPHQRLAGLSDMSGTELSRWTFNNVWPSKWSASDLDVGSDDLMTEEVTLAVEELIRNK